MSDLRWAVTEYNLGPYMTKEAAIAEAAAFRQTQAADALLYRGKQPRLIQVRQQTVDDVPADLAKDLLSEVYDLLEDHPRLTGFEAFDREFVGTSLETKLQNALLAAYKGGLTLTHDTPAWVPTGVEASLFSAEPWKF